MQVSRFFTGGYVIHKITGDFKGRVSAWFDADGNLLDAEQYPTVMGPARPVKRGGPIWRHCEAIGLRYKNVPHPAP